MWSTIIQALALIWEICKSVVPLARSFWKSRHQRRLLTHRTRGKPPSGTSAREIALVIAVIENPVLYIGKSDFPLLLAARRTLWTARLQMRDIAEHALAFRGENNEETVSAMRGMVGKHGDAALPYLKHITKNPEAHDKIRRIAQRWIDKLEKAKKASPPTE